MLLASTEEKEDDIKDGFYEELENTIIGLPKQDMLLILGDFNAKLGKEQAYQPHVGLHSLHTKSNEKGKRLVGPTVAQNIQVRMFEHKNIQNKI